MHQIDRLIPMFTKRIWCACIGSNDVMDKIGADDVVLNNDEFHIDITIVRYTFDQLFSASTIIDYIVICDDGALSLLEFYNKISRVSKMLAGKSRFCVVVSNRSTELPIFQGDIWIVPESSFTLYRFRRFGLYVGRIKAEELIAKLRREEIGAFYELDVLATEVSK